jgi:phosphoglycolate phosphatase
MPGPVRIVLFDFDGTLVDSGAVIVAALRTSLADGGIDPDQFDDQALRAYIGVPLPRLFPEIGMAADRVEHAIAHFQAYFRHHGADGTRPFAGVEPLLDELTRRGATLGLATAKPARTATEVVTHLGWLDRFAVIAGANDDETGGAKHEVIDQALAGLTIEGQRPAPGTVLMVGDRAGDITGARHHGIDGIGVTWGFGSRRELEAAEATAIVDSVADLAHALADRLAPSPVRAGAQREEAG